MNDNEKRDGKPKSVLNGIIDEDAFIDSPNPLKIDMKRLKEEVKAYDEVVVIGTENNRECYACEKERVYYE